MQVEVIVAKVVLDLSRSRSEKQIEHDNQTKSSNTCIENICTTLDINFGWGLVVLVLDPDWFVWAKS